MIRPNQPNSLPTLQELFGKIKSREPFIVNEGWTGYQDYHLSRILRHKLSVVAEHHYEDCRQHVLLYVFKRIIAADLAALTRPDVEYVGFTFNWVKGGMADYFKRHDKQCRSGVIFQPITLDAAEEMLDQQPEPQQRAEESERTAYMRRVIDGTHMTHLERESFKLVRFRGLSGTEAAAKLGTNRKAVNNALDRVMAKLHQTHRLFQSIDEKPCAETGNFWCAVCEF